MLRLSDLMNDVIAIHGRGNFPTLEVKLGRTSYITSCNLNFFSCVCFWGIYSILSWLLTGSALMYEGPLRFSSSLLAQQDDPQGAGPRYEPWTLQLAGRRANHWATPHPQMSNASARLSNASPPLISTWWNYAQFVMIFHSWDSVPPVFFISDRYNPKNCFSTKSVVTFKKLGSCL